MLMHQRIPVVFSADYYTQSVYVLDSSQFIETFVLVYKTFVLCVDLCYVVPMFSCRSFILLASWASTRVLRPTLGKRV